MIVTRSRIADALRAAGIGPGDTLLVHASLSALGHVVGGAETVVLALLDAAPGGTVATPTQTWRNLDPATGVHGRPEADWPAICDALPGFDPATTPSIGMGAVAEAIRTWPGARRSEHPVRSWSAIGPGAAELVATHDLEDVHGEASPLGAAMRANARAVLLGAGYDKCTALHLAEMRADVPSEIERLTSWRRTPQGREELSYENRLFDASDFAAIGAAFEAGASTAVIPIGAAHVRAPRLRALVPFGARMMETTR